MILIFHNITHKDGIKLKLKKCFGTGPYQLTKIIKIY